MKDLIADYVEISVVELVLEQWKKAQEIHSLVPLLLRKP
jgi:hypothetical protein